MNAVELTTSPTLSQGLDDGIAHWAGKQARLAGGQDGAAPKPRAPPKRTMSVSYLFDDVTHRVSLF